MDSIVKFAGKGLSKFNLDCVSDRTFPRLVSV
jgi:hypothetical protein